MEMESLVDDPIIQYRCQGDFFFCKIQRYSRSFFIEEFDGICKSFGRWSQQVKNIVCICHCAILQHHKDMKKNNLAAPSNFVVEVIQEDCDLCETCLERCPMDAFSIIDNRITRDAQLCIGCGLCVSTCPSEALKMVPRPEPQIPPEGQRELHAAMVASLQKDK